MTTFRSIRHKSPRCFFCRMVMKRIRLRRKGQDRVQCPKCGARAWWSDGR